jgi:hypothetical protein
VLTKLLVIFRTINAILDGRAIIIEDTGANSCKTFVGSEISRERFRVLILNHVYQIQTNPGGI